jgi:hypothetical protein
MRKGLKLCVAALTALLLTACWQKSLEPFYTEKDLIFERTLIGSWTEPKNDGDDESIKTPATWTFSQGPGEKRYRLNIIDDDFNEDFEARLFKLGDAKFLDLCSRKREISEIPAHHLVKIELNGDSLALQLQSQEWIKKWIGLHPKSLAHIRLNNPDDPDNTDETEIVLTAKTADLQKFIREHLKDAGFFGDPEKLKRVRKLAGD